MTSRPDATPGSGGTELPRQPDVPPEAPDADSDAPRLSEDVPADGVRDDEPAEPAEPGEPSDESGEAPDAESAAAAGPEEPDASAEEEAADDAADTADDIADDGAEDGLDDDAVDTADEPDDVVPERVPDDEPLDVPEVEAPPVAPDPDVAAPPVGTEAAPVAGEAAEEPARATSAAIGEPAPPATLLPGHPDDAPPAARAVARGRLGHAMRPRATRGQLLAGLLCALLGFALVVQARQTQTQGLEQLRQADLVRLLDNVTNSEARAEQDVRNQQAIRDRLLSGSDSSEAAQQAAQQRLDTLGLLAGTVPATGPGIELEISDPRRQIDASVLLDTLEELRDGGAEVVQIGDVRVVAATAFTDDAEGVKVDGRLLTPPYRYRVIGEPQTLSKVLQIPGGVLDVLRSKGAQGRVTQPPTVRVDALRDPSRPQYARPAPGGTP